MTNIIHSLDLGNRFLKYRSGYQTPRAMLSATLEVVGGSSPNIDSSTSKDIQYLDGNPEHRGRRWVVGESAREIQGYINTVSLQNKVEDALRLALATIDISTPGEAVCVERLYVTIPDPDQDGELLKTVLIGTHHIISNGVEASVTIKQVFPFAEATTGYCYAVEQGVLAKGQLNGVIDIGGGTAIGALFNARGQEIRSARAVFRKSGAFALATRIASDPELKAIARGAAAIDKIMDAIARGDYLYGTTGNSFKHLFNAHYPIWLKNVVTEVISRWDGYIDEISGIAIIGGSAPLADCLTRDPKNRWFKTCPKPQFANVLGLMPAGERAVAGVK